MSKHLFQIEKGRWPDSVKELSSQYYTSASISRAKGGALFEIEKGRQLAQSTKNVKSGPIGSSYFQKALHAKSVIHRGIQKGH